MNYINKITGRRHSSIFWIFVFVTLFISLISGYSNAGTLMPDGLVIKDKFLPGKGLVIGKVLSVQESVIIIHSDNKSGYKANKETSCL